MKTVALLLTAIICISFCSDNPAYQLFDENGKKTDFDKMMKDLEEADIILFGEYHDNPICHWLQLEVTEALYEKHGQDLILAAEMFEADNQLILDEYLRGAITESTFENEMRLWPNYETDYKPLVQFAKDNGLYFSAANIPRRYANMVYMGGFEALDSLNEEAYNYIAPLPIAYDAELGCYKEILEMSGGHGGENLPKAQAIKDATMAHFIMYCMGMESVVLHFNGAFHSDNHQGIEWYIKQGNENLNVVTISTCSQEDIDKLEEEYEGSANYIIAVPDNMTSTH